MKLKGEICMSRPSYGDGRKAMSIICSDSSSGIRFLEIEIPYDEFVMALTSSYGEMEYDLRGWMHLGKDIEIKKEKVWVPEVKGGRDVSKEAARKAVLAVESDGWTGWVEDASNRHNWVKGQSHDGGAWYYVTFRRYVEKPEVVDLKSKQA